jgi:hypothetical protein
MAPRKTLSPKIASAVAVLSRRRCCLCLFLRQHDETVRGQIAHLNRDRNDHRFDNLVYLCLEHHDEYDSVTRQSKNLMEAEVRTWRRRLVQYFDGPAADWIHDTGTALLAPPEHNGDDPSPAGGTRAWRFPLWQVEDQMDLFAYTVGGRTDGVCLIERIDLPDGRVVVACLQPPGNPGTSITNAVEKIAAQVCARLEIDPKTLVWLEHYPFMTPSEWSLVTFGAIGEQTGFVDPIWETMDEADWRALGLKPLKSLKMDSLAVRSKLKKLFPRPVLDQEEGEDLQG